MRRRFPVLAAALALALSGCTPPSDAEIAADIEKEMLSEPGGKLMVDALREEFPEAYRGLMARAVELAKANGSEQEAERVSAAYITEFFASHRDGIARAPEAEMTDLRKARLRLLQVHRTQSAALCANLADPAVVVADEPGNRQKLAISQFTAALFRAIGAGEREPLERPAVSANDYAALREAMLAAGVTTADFDMIANPAIFAASGNETKCRLETAIMKALMKMPDATANRLMVQIVNGRS